MKYDAIVVGAGAVGGYLAYKLGGYGYRVAVFADHLAPSDSEHLSPTYGAYVLSRRLTILHSYGLGVLHFPFGATFHTVRLH